MNNRQKKEKKQEKKLFCIENGDFITRYELLKTKQTTKAQIMRELNLTRTAFTVLEKRYLELRNVN